jgi:hypothetical protein
MGMVVASAKDPGWAPILVIMTDDSLHESESRVKKFTAFYGRWMKAY